MNSESTVWVIDSGHGHDMEWSLFAGWNLSFSTSHAPSIHELLHVLRAFAVMMC